MLLNRTLLIAALFLAPLSMADEGAGSDSGAIGGVSDQGVPAPSERATTPRGTQNDLDLANLPPKLQEMLTALQNQPQAQQPHDGGALKIRQTLPKLPDQKLVMGPDSTGRVFIKFHDAAKVRIDATGKLSAAQAISIEPVKEIIAGMGLTIRSAFTKSAERLRAIEIRAEAYSGKAQPDLAGMYYLEGPIGRDLETAARALNGMGVVEVTEFEVKRQTSQAVGACCEPSGGNTTCSILSSAICTANGGVYFGDGSLCGAGGGCPFSIGACCDIIGCAIETQANCSSLGDTFRDGFTCAQVNCTTGACCIVQVDNSTICLPKTQNDCVNTNDGFYSGDGVACSPDPCAGITLGSCCLWDALTGGGVGFCLMLPQADCNSRGGYFISGAICSSTNCEPGVNQGACCIPNPGGNFCQLTTLDECDLAGGQFTIGVGCSDAIRCDEIGACCVDGDCLIIRQDLCNPPNVFLGIGTNCDDTNGDPCADPACGVASTGSCLQPGGADDGSGGTRIIGPFCKDDDCCAQVCLIDPFCCDDSLAPSDPIHRPGSAGNWDSFCAFQALNFFPGVCSSGDPIPPLPLPVCMQPGTTGDCFNSHTGMGCDDENCCSSVCMIDPMCCEAIWDVACATIAQQNCNTNTTGATPNFSGSQGYLTASGYGGSSVPGVNIPPSPVFPCTFKVLRDFVPGVDGNSLIGYGGEGMDLKGLDDLAQFLFDTYGIGTQNQARGKTIRVGVIEHTAFPAHEELVGMTTEAMLDLDNNGMVDTPTILIVPTIVNLNGQHGTAVLGIIGARDDGPIGPGAGEIGIVGVAPEVALYFFPIVSVEEPAGRMLDAISSALEVFEPGDVLNFSIGLPSGATLLTSPADWIMIRLAADLGVTSCLAAGNESLNLDGFAEAGGAAGSSGGVVVGACTPGLPFCRLGFSNHCEDCGAGTPVDCSAWGDGVVTLGNFAAVDPTANDVFSDPSAPNLRTYTGCFNGTSAAAPQIAGLVARLQGLAKQFFGIPLTPDQIRSLISDNDNGFPQCGRDNFGDPIIPPGAPNGLERFGDFEYDEPPNSIGPYADSFGAGSALIQFPFFDGNSLVDNIVVVVGNLFFGNGNSILSSDNNYLVAASEFVTRGKNGGDPIGEAAFFGSGQAVDIRINAHLNTSNLTDLAIQTELKAPSVSMTGMVTIYVVDMWNWGAGRYEFVALEVLQGGGVMGPDLVFNHAPAGGAARFVNTRNDMWVRLSLLQPGGVQVGGPGGTPMGPGTFTMILDQVGIGSTIIVGNPTSGGGLGGL